MDTSIDGLFNNHVYTDSTPLYAKTRIFHPLTSGTLYAYLYLHALCRGWHCLLRLRPVNVTVVGLVIVYGLTDRTLDASGSDF